jgi:ADP-ribose pyrophosphatase YjhB (NUDIX family)
MKFCSECGGRLRTTETTVKRKSFMCAACSKAHYHNPRVVVGCIAYHGDRLLMCRRAEEPARGLWSIPSGYLECGETLEQATAREAFEETGVALDPDQLDLYNVINMTDIEQVCILFRVGLPEVPRLCAGPECLEVAFMSEVQVARLSLAWQPSLGMETRDFFQQLRTGNFAIRLVRLASACGSIYSCRSYPLAADSGPIGTEVRGVTCPN